MKNLSIALTTKFTETVGGLHNSLYLLIPNKLYKERAKQTAVLPYAVYHIVSDVPEWTFNTFFEKVRIQFDLYSDQESSSQVEDMYTALKALFDWCTLAITGNVHVYMRRELARLSRDPVDDCWAYQIDYEIMTERNP